MADDFTREHFRWLLQVSADKDVPATGFKLAFHFGQHFNRETGDAWPSQETLAAAVGVSARSVRTLTDQLVALGHLEVRRHRGPKAVNVYRAKRKPASGPENGEAEAGFRSDGEKRKFDAREAEVCDTRTGSQLPTNYLEPLQNLKRKEDRVIWFKKNQKGFTHHIQSDTPEWRRWYDYLGWCPPIDRRFGWNFPAASPPSGD